MNNLSHFSPSWFPPKPTAWLAIAVAVLLTIALLQTRTGPLRWMSLVLVGLLLLVALVKVDRTARSEGPISIIDCPRPPSRGGLPQKWANAVWIGALFGLNSVLMQPPFGLLTWVTATLVWALALIAANRDQR